MSDPLPARRRSFAPLAAILLALAWALPAFAQEWQSLGPAPISEVLFSGRAAALSLHPTKKKQYLVGTASGGVWQTTNGGKKWRPRTEALPSAAIGALARDPSRPRTVYAGTGEANYAYHSLYGLGLYKSTNGGKRWKLIASEPFEGRTFSALAVSQGDGDVIWAAVARAGGTRKGFEGARRHPEREGPLGLFRSNDGGVQWAHVRGKLPAAAASDLDIDPGDENRIFASFGDVFGTKKNGIYRSDDGGENWRRLDLGIKGRRLGRISLAISPADPQRIYALAAAPAQRKTTGGSAPGGAETLGLFRSDDGGDSWRRFSAGDLQTEFGQYYSTVAAHPSDPDRVVLGGLDLLTSADGGRSFRFITPPHVDMHAIAFDAAGRLVVANDGGVHVSDDLGGTWVARNGNLGSVQFYPGMSVHPTRSDAILGGTQDNGTSLRQGADWLKVAGGDGGWTLFDPDDPDTFWVEFQGVANLFRTTDGGLNFSQMANGIAANDRTAFQAPLVRDPSDPNRLFYATQRVYESTDGGTSWAPVSADLTGGAPFAIRSLAVSAADPQVLYAVTSDDRALVSRDRARSWTVVVDELAGWPRVMRQIATDPEDPASAVLADMRFGGSKVLETSDTGDTWRSIAGDLPDTPVNSVALRRAGGERQIFAATDQGVFWTRDGGSNWNLYGTGLPNVAVMDLLVDETHERLVVSSLGRGVWTAPLP